MSALAPKISTGRTDNSSTSMSGIQGTSLARAQRVGRSPYRAPRRPVRPCIGVGLTDDEDAKGGHRSLLRRVSTCDDVQEEAGLHEAVALLFPRHLDPHAVGAVASFHHQLRSMLQQCV